MSEQLDKHYFPDCSMFDLSAHEFNAIAAELNIEFEPVSSSEWVRARSNPLHHHAPQGVDIVLSKRDGGGFNVLHGADAIPWRMDFRDFGSMKFILFEGQDPPDFTALRDRCVNLLTRYGNGIANALHQIPRTAPTKTEWRICLRSREVERVAIPAGLDVLAVYDYGPFLGVSGTLGLDWPARIMLVSGDGIQPVNHLPYEQEGDGLGFPFIEYPFRCTECPACQRAFAAS